MLNTLNVSCTVGRKIESQPVVDSYEMRKVAGVYKFDDANMDNIRVVSYGNTAFTLRPLFVNMTVGSIQNMTNVWEQSRFIKVDEVLNIQIS